MKHKTLHPVQALRSSRPDEPVWASETIADETPVALVYNGLPHAVMMATPADLQDFARGFSLTEGIVDDVAEIEIVDQLEGADGISLQLLIPRVRALALLERQRNLTGRTGCGLCGAATLESAIRPIRRVSTRARFDSAGLQWGFEQLAARQPLNAQCGALHAAALLGEQGEIFVREDVGRHNAVDKVVGAASQSAVVPRMLLVTSRASYEVVHKAAQADCPLVAAISAPTALAVRMAREAGITLIGFARDRRYTVYCGDNWIAVDNRCLPA